MTGDTSNPQGTRSVYNFILEKDILEGVRITIPTEEDASSGDNFIMDDININEHYISRDEIKRHSEKDNQKHKNIKKR